MRSSHLLLLVAISSTPLLVASDARAGDVVAAEHDRLSDELANLVKRQVWTGAERKYLELEKLGIELSLDDYLNGAYAARELGDVESAYVRLQNAARLGGSKEIVDWLWDIDHNYGRVELIMVPARSAELVCQEMPFDPNQRKSVETAIKAAKAEGTYIGMLPKGRYSFAGLEFSVDPGVGVRLEVSPKVRKNGPIDPVIRKPTLPGTATENQSAGATPTTPPPPTAPTTTPAPAGDDEN